MYTAKPPCDHCGGAVRITDTRVFKDGQVHRRSRCEECGARYRTIEIREEEYDRLRRQVDDYYEMRRMLQVTFNSRG